MMHRASKFCLVSDGQPLRENISNGKEGLVENIPVKNSPRQEFL